MTPMEQEKSKEETLKKLRTYSKKSMLRKQLKFLQIPYTTKKMAYKEGWRDALDWICRNQIHN